MKGTISPEMNQLLRDRKHWNEFINLPTVEARSEYMNWYAKTFCQNINLKRSSSWASKTLISFLVFAILMIGSAMIAIPVWVGYGVSIIIAYFIMVTE